VPEETEAGSAEEQPVRDNPAGWA